jgi:hypothetical protein
VPASRRHARSARAARPLVPGRPVDLDHPPPGERDAVGGEHADGRGHALRLRAGRAEHLVPRQRERSAFPGADPGGPQGDGALRGAGEGRPARHGAGVRHARDPLRREAARPLRRRADARGPAGRARWATRTWRAAGTISGRSPRRPSPT